jgi:ubiquinone/menaquinone biosynthesis C-methylase UbiE
LSPDVGDLDDQRRESRARWETAAPNWAAQADLIARAHRPVAHRMVEAIRPQPGHVVLELAAGLGDTGLLAAELIAPGGKLICTDGAEAMVEAARERAERVGIENAEFRTMELEWIDLPAASVDAILCRFGYMLAVDPEAGLRDARRVLRPEGRIALAVWGSPDDNPWMTAIGKAMTAAGHVEPPAPGTPGPFVLSAAGLLEQLLDAAGFFDIAVEPVDIVQEASSGDEYWERMVPLAPALSENLRKLSPAEHTAVRDAVDDAWAPYRADDGSLALPGRALVASASS